MKTKLGRSIRLLAGVAYAALAMNAAVLPAAAQETQTFKVTHLFNATVYLWEHGGKVFVEEIEKAAGDKAKFEVYPSAQLGKDPITTLKSGLADIGIVIPSYAADKLPLTSVAELPGSYASACEGTGKLWNVAKAGGLLNETEYKPQGLHVLFVTTLPPYHVTTAKPITADLASISGLKLRAVGAAMDKAVRALGAVPVKMAASELYDALSRGTIDGGFYNYLGIPEYKLEEVLKYSVDGPRLGAASIVFAMSQQSWEALSEEMKTIFTEASAKAQTALCEWDDQHDAEIRKDIVANKGHTIIELTPEQTAVWEGKAAEVATDWVKEMDAAGKNGTAIYEAFNTSN